MYIQKLDNIRHFVCLPIVDSLFVGYPNVTLISLYVAYSVAELFCKFGWYGGSS